MTCGLPSVHFAVRGHRITLTKGPRMLSSQHVIVGLIVIASSSGVLAYDPNDFSQHDNHWC